MNEELKQQLAQYLELLENQVIIEASLADDENSKKVREFLESVVVLSDQLELKETSLEYTPSFELTTASGSSGITFAGVPLGHEFESFVLALLQAGGRAPVIHDSQKKAIESIDEELNFVTFVSLTCQNCPVVVQALDIMSVLNPNITHTMIEGSMFPELVEKENIRAVPSTYLNGEHFTNGRKSLDQLIGLVADTQDTSHFDELDPYDVLIIGGGPAGTSAAIYAARKGIRTGIVAEDFGGQVMDTSAVENFIGTPSIQGPELMAKMRKHVEAYDIDIHEGLKVEEITKEDLVEVKLENGGVLRSRTLIIATGARWRLIHVPGELELRDKGISYCPHCDGPFFEDEEVVVIGGGNSGVEAALDMSYLAEKVTVLEYTDSLKADTILQERLAERKNVNVIVNADTTEINGEDEVEGVTYKDRNTGEIHHLEAKGVFILVGLVPNTEWLDDSIELNKFGEIITDERQATNSDSIYAAGDCTDTIYKQIVVALGQGATAALSAYDQLLREGL